MTRFIDVSRFFTPVTTDPELERSQRTRSRWFPSETVTWNDLLSKPCSIVLGEAGSGKTAELRHKTTELRDQGRDAFFLPIEAVVKRGVARSLELQQAKALREWMAGTDDAWFFLDSVDESKLKGHSLSGALATFAHELEPGLNRAHVIISSRASDWRSVDEDDVAGLWPHLAPPKTDETRAAVLELAPLDTTQVLAFARHFGLIEESRFLKEVGDANAWSFLERPLDVQWLVGFWNRHKRLGTLRQLLDNHITERLKERSDRVPSTVSVERARAGARKLALVAQLTGSSTFRLPGELPDARSADAIDPSSVLTDWTNAEVSELLSRGLFDEATYGRVRLHHRSSEEFLAAEQLLWMRDAGLPREDIHALLFRATPGGLCVPSNLIGLVAWCALEDREVRRNAIVSIPEHLLDQGDPSELPPDERRDVLVAYAQQYGDRERVFHYFDAFGLKRFACAEIVGTLRQLLSEPTVPSHLKGLLLGIVEHGNVTSVVDLAVELAVGERTAPELRRDAIDTVAKAGSFAERARLLELMGTAAGRDRNTAARCIAVLFPNDMTVEHLTQWLLDVPAPAEDRTTALEAIVSSEVSKRCSSDQRRFLMHVLAEEMVQPSKDPEATEPEARPNRLWLGDLLGVLLQDSLSDPLIEPGLLDRAFVAIAACENEYRTTLNHRLTRIIRTDEAVRRGFFWRRARLRHQATGRFPRNNWELGLRSWFGLGARDATWLRSDAESLTVVHERLLAFDTLIHVSPRTPETTAKFWEAMTAVATIGDERHSTVALRKRLARLRVRSMPSDFPAERLWKRANDRREETERQNSLENLRKILPDIQSGRCRRALAHLHDIVPDDGPHWNYSTISFEAISARYDAEVSSAAREGLKRFWRRGTPVRIETRRPSGTPWSSILGLAGIAVEVAEGLNVATLPDDLLRRALTFAPWEMNGFPSWVEGCASARPALARDVLGPALRRDYKMQAETAGTWHTRALGKLGHEEPAILKACAPVLVELLREGDPPEPEALRHVLDVLAPIEGVGIADIASERTRAARLGGVQFNLWWVHWLSLAPEGAVAYLEANLVGAADADALVEQLCIRAWMVFCERIPQKASTTRAESRSSPLRNSPKALARLTLLVHAHIKPEDDIKHESGRLHAVQDRDNAQQLRDSLLSWLAAIDSPEGSRALEQLLAGSAFRASQRDWVAHLSKTRAIADVSKPMSTSDAVAFTASMILEPISARDLFRIALDRLRDIQHHITNSDFSTRAVYNPDDRIQEKPVQIFLAGELEQRARKQFSVVRESEVVDNNEPDIRLWSPRCGGPISIEVKIAERWSVTELEESIGTQLVGKYMRASNSNYGTLVLCSSGPRHAWRHNGKTLDFKGLVSHLQSFAKSVLARTPTIGDVAVIPIDFH